MQTATGVKRRTHWLAGLLAVAVTAVMFGTQVMLAEHYAQTGTNAGESSFASRKTPANLAIRQAAENPAQFKTTAQNNVIKATTEKQPAS